MSNKSKSEEAFEFPFELEKAFGPNQFGKLPKWQQEIVSFYNRRLKSYSKFHEQLAECGNPQDVFELQSQFFNTLFSDYRNEAAVISELLFDMSRPVVEKTQEATETGYEETILKAQRDAEKILSLAKSQAEVLIETAEAKADSQSKDNKESSKVA
jgi:hypothetical protein